MGFDPGLWDVSAEFYHADTTSVSHSALEVFRRSPRLYHGRYVTGEIAHPEPTSQMLLGSALHCLVLEPEAFSQRYYCAEACDRRTKAGRAAWAELEEMAAGRELLSAPMWDQVHRMRDAVSTEPLAARLLEAPGLTEQSIRWLSSTGIPCKARFDRLTGAILLDLKTASDPGENAWVLAAKAFGYHRQQAWYMCGAWEALHRDTQFIFIVVGSTEPYDCHVREFTTRDLELGQRQNNADLARLQRARDTGRYHHATWGQLETISLPRWAHLED